MVLIIPHSESSKVLGYLSWVKHKRKFNIARTYMYVQNFVTLHELLIYIDISN